MGSRGQPFSHIAPQFIAALWAAAILRRVQRLVIRLLIAYAAIPHLFLAVVSVVVAVDKGLIRAEIVPFWAIGGVGHGPTANLN